MTESRCPFLLLRVILLFLVTSGNSLEFFGEDTTSTSGDPESDEGVVKLLEQLSKMKKPSSSAGSQSNSTVAAVDLHDIVIARFRKEMAVVFSWLPEPNKCRTLMAVTRTTLCRTSSVIELVFNLTEVKHIVNITCPDEGSIKLKACFEANQTEVEAVFYHELEGLFVSLPPPFKCNVINNIAMIYKLKGRRQLENKYGPTMSISRAQEEVAKLFPSIKLPQTCADVGNSKNDMIPSIPVVNLTVNITGADKATWLNNFEKKGPEIYRIVCEHEAQLFKEDKFSLGSPLIGSSADSKELVNSTQLIISSVDDGNETFSVLFGLKVKKKQGGRLREMRSTHKIVQALQALNQGKLNAVVGARVISITLKGQKPNTTKQATGTDTWNLKQIGRAQDLFPHHLSAYYKQLGKPARCFIVFYISLKIKKKPIVLEMFYSSFGLLSRKHSCYYTARTSTLQPIIPTIVRELYTRGTTATTETVHSTRFPPVNSTKKSSSALDETSVEVDEEGVLALEIALFCLLGLLCIAILAFTINCVLFAFKTKSPNPNGAAMGTAVLYKAAKDTASGSKCDCVHIALTQRNKNGQLKPCDTQRPLPLDMSTTCGIEKKCPCSPNALDASLYSHSALPSYASCHKGSNDLQSSSEVLDYAVGDRSPRTSNSITSLQDSWSLKSLSNISVAAETEISYTVQPHKYTSTEGCSGMASCGSTSPSCSQQPFDDHLQDKGAVLESPGTAVSCLSSTNSGVEPSKLVHNGCLPSEQSHESVFVMLNCKGLKEEQV